MNYILAILGFGILIIVHELGHFVVAKINKVKVLEFSIGMGPRIFTYEGKETKYSLALLPIGGQVLLLNGEEYLDDPGNMLNKSHLRRISIIVAGVVMNFLLAIILFTACNMHFGYTEKVIDEVVENSAASEAGFNVGDEIVKINSNKIFTYDDVSLTIAEAKDADMNILVKRNGENKSLSVTPRFNDELQSYLIGVKFTNIPEPGVVSSLKHSFKETATLIKQTANSIKKLVTGRGSFKTDIGGPVTIVKISAQVASVGVWNLLYLIGFLSISLAVFNSLPFPMLDGGTTFILLIEMITRRKVPEKILIGINTVGFVLLMALMAVVTVKDILFPVKF